GAPAVARRHRFSVAAEAGSPPGLSAHGLASREGLRRFHVRAAFRRSLCGRLARSRKVTLWPAKVRLQAVTLQRITSHRRRAGSSAYTPTVTCLTSRRHYPGKPSSRAGELKFCSAHDLERRSRFHAVIHAADIYCGGTMKTPTLFIDRDGTL